MRSVQTHKPAKGDSMSSETTINLHKVKRKSHSCQWWAIPCLRTPWVEWQAWECKTTWCNSRWAMAWTKECNHSLAADLVNKISWTNLVVASISSRILPQASNKHNSHHSLRKVPLSTSQSSSLWIQASALSSLHRSLKLKTTIPFRTALSI